MLFKRYWVILGIFCSHLLASDIIVEKNAKDIESLSKAYLDNYEMLSGDNIYDQLDKYDDESGVLSLKTLLEKAKDNYTMQAKNIAINEAEATRDSVIGRYLPSVDVGYNFNSTKAYPVNSWNKALNAHQAQASANWVIFDGASREFSLLSNNALVRAAIADKGYTQESMFLQVISYYYQYFSLKGQILAMEQKQNNIHSNIIRIEILYKAGLQPLEALESLKAEYSLTNYQLEELRLNFEQTKMQLSLLTNIEVDKLMLSKMQDVCASCEDKVKQNLNITMQEEQALSVDYQVGTLTYWPTLSLFDTYSWNFKNNATSVYGAFGDSMIARQYPKHQNVFGLSVTWNIFSGFTTNRQKEALKLSNLKMQKMITYAKEEQKNNVKFYRRSIEAADLQVKSAEAALNSATTSFLTILSKFQSNLVGYNDYLDSLIARYNAESTYIQSLNNYELQKANYIFYSGQTLLDYIN